MALHSHILVRRFWPLVMLDRSYLEVLLSTQALDFEKGLVVGGRVGWNGGGGHMVFHGTFRQQGGEYLPIDDSISGKNTLSWQQFATNYQGSGSATYICFTKKKRYCMCSKDLVFNAKRFEPIFKFRPLLDLYGQAGDPKQAIPDTAFSTPRYDYLVRLDEIKRDMKLPTAPSAMRVVETDDEKALTMYEVGVDPEHRGAAAGQQRSAPVRSGRFRVGYAETADSRIGSTPELRTIRMPALDIGALWLY